MTSINLLTIMQKLIYWLYNSKQDTAIYLMMKEKINKKINENNKKKKKT